MSVQFDGKEMVSIPCGPSEEDKVKIQKRGKTQSEFVNKAPADAYLNFAQSRAQTIFIDIQFDFFTGKVWTPKIRFLDKNKNKLFKYILHNYFHNTFYNKCKK